MAIETMDLTQRLKGKVAVITGGASGIGLATARRMAAEGAIIVIGDMNPESGEAAAAEVGGLFIKVNVTDEDEVNNLFDTAASTYGSVDIAFNNAGISPPDDDSIETTDVVELGPELVALKAWEELHFTPMLEALGMNPSAIATAQLMVSNRLIEPLSEWALIDWSHRTALPELLDIRITKSAKDRLYRTSDDLMALRKDIESTLCERERDLFSLSRSVILYDVTQTASAWR